MPRRAPTPIPDGIEPERSGPNGEPDSTPPRKRASKPPFRVIAEHVTSWRTVVGAALALLVFGGMLNAYLGDVAKKRDIDTIDVRLNAVEAKVETLSARFNDAYERLGQHSQQLYNIAKAVSAEIVGPPRSSSTEPTR